MKLVYIEQAIYQTLIDINKAQENAELLSELFRQLSYLKDLKIRILENRLNELRGRV